MGFILEGSKHPNLLYDAPLTASPPNGVATNATFDENGVVFSADGNLAFDFTSLGFPASIATQGQINVFLENDAIGLNQPLDGNQGDPTGANSYVYTFSSTLIGTVFGRHRITAAGTLSPQINAADAQINLATTTGSAPTSQLILHSFSWLGGNTYSVFANGRKLIFNAAGTPFADMMNFLWLASAKGATGGTPVGKRYSRLSIASIAVTFTDSGKLMAIGDSFIGTESFEVATPGGSVFGPSLWDVNVANEIQALERIHNGGEYTYQDEGVGGETTAEVLARTAAALAANNPKIAWIRLGTNDANNVGGVPSTQQADYKSIISLCANFPSVERVICENIITIKGDTAFDAPQFVTQVAEVNLNIADAAQSFTAENQGKLVVLVDSFSAFGGENPSVSPQAESLIIGIQNGAQDNLHSSAQGEALRASLVQSAIGSPLMSVDYPNLTNDVGDVVDVDLAPNWVDSQNLHYEIFQRPEATEAIVGLPGQARISGELTEKTVAKVQVLATDRASGLSTLSNIFDWTINRLAVLPSVANQLSGLGGPAVGLVPVTAFDVPIPGIARLLYARVTGDVAIVGLDGVEFIYTVVTVGIQDIAFVQINTTGTTGTTADYDGLL